MKNISALALICTMYIGTGNASYELRTTLKNHSLTPSTPQTNDAACNVDVHELTLTTDSGTKFPILFFDRQSPIVLVLGQQFPGSKESMLSFAHAFKNYDIIMFDYRWNNLTSYSCHPATLFNPIKRFLYDPEEEIHSIISFLLSRKPYREIVGLGECYSNYMFVRAQVHAQKQHKPFFTKLILDSCWLSLKSFMQQIIRDPWLPSYPQHGGGNNALKKFLNISWVNKFAYACANRATPDASIIEWLQQLKNTPLLFIHGRNDLMVPLSDFETIWQATRNIPKAAIITPYQHCDNFHDKRWYIHLCETFINSFSIDSFERAIKQ